MRCRARAGNKWHYVKAGETLFDISQQYGVKSSRLRNRNRIPDSAELQANQRLKLRGFNIAKGDQPRLTSEPKPTLSVPPLLDADDDFMQDDDVAPEPPEQPGVFVPDTPTDNPGQPAGATYHTVEIGDTLYNISRRYGITVDVLKQLNNMTDNNIKIGQSLRVK